MPTLPTAQSASSRRWQTSPSRQSRLPAVVLGLLLVAGSCSRALAQPAAAPVKIDTAAVGAAVGRDVARRWCAGDDPKRAIELALLAYLNSMRIAPSELPEATSEAVGKEIAVEAFAQAFSSCPQTARRLFRSMMD